MVMKVAGKEAPLAQMQIPKRLLQLHLQALAIPDSRPLLPHSLMRSPKLPLELQSHPDEVLPSARQRSNGQEYKGSNC